METTKENNLEEVSEALIIEMEGEKASIYMDYSKLAEDTKFKRLKR